MMPRLSSRNQCRRSSANERRRPSSDSGNSSSNTSMSMSSSFAHALELPLRYVETNHSHNSVGNGSNSSLSRTAPSMKSSFKSHRPCGPSSIDRAQRVTQDYRLQKLLAEKIETSGVVTTAGYNAVLQEFLMSEEVEQEMTREANHEKRRSASKRQSGGLFGSIVSSLTAPQNQTKIMTRRSSDISSDVRKFTNGPSRRLSANDSNSSNIAPKRDFSRRNILLTREQSEKFNELQELGDELKELEEYQERQAMGDSFLLSCRSEDDGGCDHNESCTREENDSDTSSSKSPPRYLKGSLTKDNATSPTIGTNNSHRSSLLLRHQRQAFRLRHQRQESDESLDLQDIFHETKGAHLFPPSHPVTMLLAKKSIASLDVVTATCTTTSSFPKPAAVAVLDSLSLNNKSDGNHEVGNESIENDDESQSSDQCGWLSWPEQKEVDASVSSNNGDASMKKGGEILLSRDTHGDLHLVSFEPWPITKYERAHSA